MENLRQNFIEKTHEIIDSPVGKLTLVASREALLALLWGETTTRDSKLRTSEVECPILDLAKAQLNEYFLGLRTRFEIPLKPEGTPFQKSVWQELLKIPYGEKISYAEQARRLQKPLAARAVGAANGKNPISIIVPCHRVVATSGHLTGFAGGLPIKEKLLALESGKPLP